MDPRVQTAMVVASGGRPQGAVKVLEGGAELAGRISVLADTSAANAEATITSNLLNTILQGKIIDAVLETAINTDLPGNLRALVSRDIYAEKGKAILIPKGSRLIGKYNADVKRGQGRVYIIWSRLIRPDGIDIMLESPATDELGRSGIPGMVDGKYLEIFGNSILLSTITIAVSSAAEGLTGQGEVTQGETGSGDTTQSGSATDIAIVNAVDDFGNIVSQVANDLVQVKPTITIDQGERLKVFVNKDLIFPDVDEQGINIIQ